MKRTYIGKKQLVCDDGKITDCDYNTFNNNFLNVCFRKYKSLVLNNYKNIFPAIKEAIGALIGIPLLVLVTFIPFHIPILVYLDRERIKKKYSEKELFKWKF